MSKTIKRLEKDNAALRKKANESDMTLIQLAEENARSRQQIASLLQQKKKLEDLCRALHMTRSVPVSPPQLQPQPIPGNATQKPQTTTTGSVAAAETAATVELMMPPPKLPKQKAAVPETPAQPPRQQIPPPLPPPPALQAPLLPQHSSQPRQKSQQ